MNRILRAAVPLLVLMACVVGSAEAGLRFVHKPLVFRNYMTAGNVKNVVLSGTATTAYTDSSWHSLNSVSVAPGAADTTAWFTLTDRGFAPFVLGADSLSLLSVYVTPDYTQGSAVAADTLTATLQGSFNGVDVCAGVATDIVEVGSSNTFWKAFQWTRGSTAATTTNLNIGMFPYYRVIISDWSGTTGQFGIGVAYWRDVTNLEKGD